MLQLSYLVPIVRHVDTPAPPWRRSRLQISTDGQFGRKKRSGASATVTALRSHEAAHGQQSMTGRGIRCLDIL